MGFGGLDFDDAGDPELTGELLAEFESPEADREVEVPASVGQASGCDPFGLSP